MNWRSFQIEGFFWGDHVMKTGAITGYIDVAQIVLYGFWIFFAGLIIYLRKEDKREGYPLESDRSGRVRVQGFPAMPKPKTFLLEDGTTVQVPRSEVDGRQIMARAMGSYLGAPLQPTGNPMSDAVGPAAYALRANHPDTTIDGMPMIVPLRLAAGYTVSEQDPDPRGMEVLGADRERGGIVRDIWVDRAEPQIRYLEVETGSLRRVLLPITFAKIDGGRRQIKVKSILGSQFAMAPGLASPDQVTRREEDQISAYYSSGNLYATPARAEPFL
jgi:photosynthetic reaction center H subunit